MQTEQEKARDWIDQTLAINNTEIPEVLFKYFSSESKHFIESITELLINNKIYLSSRKQFNDPFDSQLNIPVLTTDEIQKYISDLETRHTFPAGKKEELTNLSKDPTSFRENMINQQHITLDNLGIYSLCSTETNPLMWAHYACSHKGLVVIINNSNSEFLGAMPVRYLNQSKTPVTEIDFYSIYIKGESWKYEEEWRIIESNNANQYKVLPKNSIHGIIFGANCLSETKETIHQLIAKRDLSKHPKVELYQAECDFDLQQIKIQSNL